MENKDEMTVTVYGRAAFLRIDKPERFQGIGDPRYSASLIVEPGSDSDKKIRAAMRAAAAKEWGEDKADKAVASLTKAMKVAYIDGDTKPDVDGYEGNFILQAHAKVNQPPLLVQSVDGKNVRLDRESQTTIYSGCYVNMRVSFWPQDNQWGKRINAQLAGIQFVKNGAPFSGGRPASTDDFDVVEGDDSGSDDFAAASDDGDDIPF